MRQFILLLILNLFFSCNYVEKNKNNQFNEPVVASVNGVDLHLSNIKDVAPKGIPKKDSTILVKSYIISWAKKQLLLEKATENISEQSTQEISNLVKNYQESLLINRYKEKLVKQQLDTVVTEEEVTNYYIKNKDNFKLNKPILQLKYVYFGKDFFNKKEVVKKFKSTKEEDLETLENLTLNFKKYHLRDSTWLPLDKVLLKIPPFQKEPTQKLLKISKFIQKEDSLGVYLVAVKKVLQRNQNAPLSYIKESIKQLILHKRKLELIREIEKTLINDAIKNNNFKEY